MNWFKRVVKRFSDWLNKAEPPPRMRLLIYQAGNSVTVEVEVVEMVGEYLRVREGLREYLVKRSWCVNPQEFDRIWEHLNQGRACWADGTPFRPL